MYAQRYVEARSFFHFCCGKAMSMTYSEYVFVVLVMQHAMRMRYIAICVPSRSTIFAQNSLPPKLLNIKCVF
jgi:hypothetical protein